MAIDLYTWPTPNGWKPAIMIEELREAGVDLPDVSVHMTDLAAGDHFNPEFTALNPNQKIPTLVHDGRSIIESCAILQYLGETFPTALLPQGEARWDVIPWLYWQAANLGPAFGNKLSYTRYINVPEAEKAHPLERFEKEALRLLAVMDHQLAKHDFICGETFTVADIAAVPWIRGYKWAKIDITTQPRVVDWLERIQARPPVQRGFAYGVPEDEVNRFSEKRRDEYRKAGASIASNDALRTKV